MARDVLLDTSGLYALADRRDSSQPQAVTTDRHSVEAGLKLMLPLA